MIFADKLIQLRKKSGWSQEELAEQMNVTRQSVSKWEGAQSIPDLEKMLRLSSLFGVSTDYLLKDEIENAENADFTEDISSVKRISMEEANAFLSVKEKTAKQAAYATLLCILSPVCLFVLGAMSQMPSYGLSKTAAGGIGILVLICFVAAAVGLYVLSGKETSRFAYLEQELFETEYGVTGMVKGREDRYNDTYSKSNILGAVLCVLSLVPLLGSVVFGNKGAASFALMFSIALVLVGIAVFFFIRSGVIRASFEKLLQESNYTKYKKEARRFVAAATTVYWSLAIAIYFVYSLSTNQWGYGGIILAAAGVLYPALLAVCHAFPRKK